MRMPGAEDWFLPPGVNHSNDSVRRPPRGVVLHVIVGSLVAADSVFNNPDRQASAHFGVGKTGRLVQWVDTADKAWAQGAGNPDWISIETEGHPTEALTDAQLTVCARVVRWVKETHGGFELVEANSPTDRGLGTHVMGGVAWGNHGCPGTIRASQRGEILRRARGTVAPPSPPLPKPRKGKHMYVAFSPTDATNARWLVWPEPTAESSIGKRRWIGDGRELQVLEIACGPAIAVPIDILAAVPTVGPVPGP